MKKIDTIVEGTETFRIVDLATRCESFTNDRMEAYRYAGFFISLGHLTQIEERDSEGNVLKTFDSYRMAS